MNKVQKNFFVFSGLIMLLVQIIGLAVCDVTAIAVTPQIDTEKELFNNEYGKAMIDYEDLGNHKVRWSVQLEKVQQEPKTRLILNLFADGKAVVPANVQTTKQTDPAISFGNKDENGQSVPQVLEMAEGSSTGSAQITFETTQALKQLTIKPQLLEVTDATKNLLAEDSEVIFDLTSKTSATTETTESQPDIQSTKSSTTEVKETTTSTSIEPKTSTSSSVDVDDAQIQTSLYTASPTTLSGTLPQGSELVISSEVDNSIGDVALTTTNGKVYTKTGNKDKTNYGNLAGYENNVYSMYGKISGAKAVVLPTDKTQLKNTIVTVKYPNVGTYKGNPIGARVTVSNFIKADETSFAGVTTPVIDFASKLYSGMVYDDIKGMDISFDFLDANGNPLVLQGESYLTFASLNSKADNDGRGAEYVFSHNTAPANVTDSTFLAKGTPTGRTNTYPYKGTDAYFGNGNFNPYDKLNDPRYVDGAVSFNINNGAKFSFGSLASRAWTSFMSSVLVPIEAAPPTKRVSEKTEWKDRNADELDILVAGQEKVNLNGKTKHSYFINQPLYSIDQSIARPTTIHFHDVLPEYVKPTGIRLLQSNGEIANLTHHISGISKDPTTNRYTLDFDLTAEEMAKVVFDGKDLTWRIDVVLDGAEDKATELGETIYMENQANVAFKKDNDILFANDTNKVKTQVVPELFSLSVEKEWKGDEAYPQLRQDITLQLQKSIDQTTWENVDTFKIAKDSKDLTKKFDVAKKMNGKMIYYRILEMIDGGGERVLGYADPEYANPRTITFESNQKVLKVTNELLMTDLSFTKVGNDEKTPLAGVGFHLTGNNGYNENVTTTADGKVDFSKLPIGSYTLIETTVPNGYQASGPWTFNVIQAADGKLQIEWSSDNPIVDDKLINTLKPFDLTVEKVDEEEQALAGAEFTLTGPDYSKVIANGPTFKFDELKPGTYTLEETKTPAGYRTIKPITMIIDELGKVTIDGDEQKDVLVTGAENNQIKLQVKNIPKSPLPATGGSGIWPILASGLLALTVVGIYFWWRKEQEVA